MSVAGTRQCARAEQCVWYDREGKPGKLGSRNPDDICEACRKAGHVAGEDRVRRTKKRLGRRYEGLLRAATALLEEDEATESEVMATCAFAALTPLVDRPLRGGAPTVPRLGRIQGMFAAATRSEWDRLALRFYNTFEPLEAKRVVDGVLVVGRASNRVEAVYEPETGLVDSIVLEVDELSVKEKRVGDLYERALARYGLNWSEAEDGPISGEPRAGTIHMVARPIRGGPVRPGEEDQRLFPPPDQVRAFFARQRRTGGADLQGRPSGHDFDRGNLIAACVAWCLGARGVLVKGRKVRGRLLKKNRALERAVPALLDENGLALQSEGKPLPEKGWANKKSSAGRRIGKVDPAMRRIESILWYGPALGSRDPELYF